MRVSIAALLIVLLGGAGSQHAAAAPVLERVVMVSRHGVRAPTRTAEVLQSLTRRQWPAWPRGAGEMTEHGTKALGFMADYLRATYAQAGLLPTRGCPPAGNIEVWADALDNRTRQSGDVFAGRLAPGCGVISRFEPDRKLDPLFDASKTDACPIGLLKQGGALLTAARQKSGLLRPEDRRALAALQTILAPNACTAGGHGLCLVPEENASTVRTSGALTLGAMVAEGIYLEYVEGLPLTDVGWGNVADAATIETIMPVHERGIGILRATPVMAARRGVVLARTIVALLGRTSLPAGAPKLSSDAKLLMLAGHDSNLLYLAALMGLDWTFPGQPTMTPPDATLAFEVWRDAPSDRRILRVKAYAQTLAQLRDATPLGDLQRPDVVPVTPDACTNAGRSCPLQTFTTAVDQRLASLCGN